MSLDLSTRRKRLVYRWDLDKTYLRTEFDSIRDLVRTAFEPAARKQTVPGASALLRELRKTDPARIFILSGSPEQMRGVLEAKLRLDGVHWDALTLKPSLRNLARGKFRFVRDQVAYKLAALLRSRTELNPNTFEVLFGDDAETDAFIYSLYADLGAGLVSQQMLMDVLTQARVYPDDIPQIVRMAARMPRGETVARIFIHLEQVSPVRAFAPYGKRVCPFHNYFQPALLLAQDGAIDADAALRVGVDLSMSRNFSPDVLQASFHDLLKRGYITSVLPARFAALQGSLTEAAYGGSAAMLQAFADEVAAHADGLPDSIDDDVEPTDYVELFVRHRERVSEAKRRQGRRSHKR